MKRNTDMAKIAGTAILASALIAAAGRGYGAKTASPHDAGIGKPPEERGSRTDWHLAAPIPLRKGDLVFRRGDGLWTGCFVNASTRERKFSHVGIAATGGRNPRIIHAEADDFGAGGCVKLQRWSDFQKDSFMAAVYRIEPEGDPDFAARAVECAKKRLGMPFDPSFSLADTNRLYCTQFVRDAVNEAAGREIIGTTFANGVEIVAIDDCYARNARKIFEAGEPPPPAPFRFSLLQAPARPPQPSRAADRVPPPRPPE